MHKIRPSQPEKKNLPNLTLHLRNIFFKSDKLGKVCQMHFLNTLDISRKQVRTAMKKLTEEGNRESYQHKKTNNHKLSDKLINQVIEHVCKF